MTASPSPTPSSSPSSSRPASSPANTAFDSSSRPTFLPLSLPPISQFESRYPPAAYDQGYTRGPSRSPSVPLPLGSPSQRRPRHGREGSDESTAAATPPDTKPMANPFTEETKQADSPEGSQQEPHKLLKKKRTRTLTTPHQSAVLHQLLAQSRFPTTAMREDVGRSIGLSARKVQVWFQNQRQKARKPRFQNPENAPLIDLHRHVPYGLYAGISQPEAGPVAGPSGVSPPSSQAVSQGGRPAGTPPELPSPPRGMPIPMVASRQSLSDTSRYHELNSQYSGNVSGAVSPVSPSSGGRYFGHAGSSLSPHYSATASYPPEYGRRSTSMPFPASSSVPGHGEPPIQLPPLRFDHPNLQSSSQRSLRTSTSVPSLAGLEISPTSSSSRAILPPPVTLQPAPQWDWDRFLPPSLGGVSSDTPPLGMSDSSTHSPEGRGAPALMAQPWLFSSEHSRTHIGESSGIYNPARGAAYEDTLPGSGEGPASRQHSTTSYDLSRFSETSRETSRPNTGGQEEVYRRVGGGGLQPHSPTDKPSEELTRKEKE